MHPSGAVCQLLADILHAVNQAISHFWNGYSTAPELTQAGLKASSQVERVIEGSFQAELDWLAAAKEPHGLLVLRPSVVYQFPTHVVSLLSGASGEGTPIVCLSTYTLKYETSMAVAGRD